MDQYTKTIIMSYLKVIITLSVIIGAGILIYKSIKYIRGIIKRIRLINRLRKVCYMHNYNLQINESPLKSFFVKTRIPELTIKADDKLYNIKFITLINPSSKYTLDGFDNIYETSSFNPVFVSFRGLGSGLHFGKIADMKKKGTDKLYFSNFVQVGGESTKKFSFKPQKGIEFPEHNNVSYNIICINPTSSEMHKVVGNRTEIIFDGDFYQDCYIYSGNGLIEFFEHLST